MLSITILFTSLLAGFAVAQNSTQSLDPNSVDLTTRSMWSSCSQRAMLTCVQQINGARRTAQLPDSLRRTRVHNHEHVQRRKSQLPVSSPQKAPSMIPIPIPPTYFQCLSFLSLPSTLTLIISQFTARSLLQLYLLQRYWPRKHSPIFQHSPQLHLLSDLHQLRQSKSQLQPTVHKVWTTPSQRRPGIN